ncbi:MAG: DUF4157 domain-containing protein [Pyrinomonadaceae bacterium]
MVGSLLQRKCGCGQHTMNGGQCASCSNKGQTLQRSSHQQLDTSGVPETVHEVLRSPGQPLDAATRSFMEPRFGHDLSRVPAYTGGGRIGGNLAIGKADDPAEQQAERAASMVAQQPASSLDAPRAGYDLSRVRVHTSGRAAESAQSLGALAYTVGEHVVFGAGQYAPGTTGGAKLLAHELTHVVQQNSEVIRRTPDAATLQTFDTRAAAIRSHAAYRALRAGHRTIADDIIRIARSRDNCLYYIDKLTLLINTPDAPRASVSSTVSQQTSQFATDERDRLATAEGQRLAGVEESMANDPARRWTRRRGQDGVLFETDNRDPNNIVVRARVRLVRRGRSTRQDVLNIRSLEDAIEKAASTGGYTVNLEFVDRGGGDVFTVGVDTSQWVTSGNWVGAGQSLAHELHHLLGLDDRYDYIESHADNDAMVMGDRLYWFRVQMARIPDPNINTSIMGFGTSPVDDDVCRVAGLNMAACLIARDMRAREIRSARGRAFGRCFRALEVLNRLRPASPFDQPGEPSANDIAQRGAQALARRIFGQNILLEQLSDLVATMRDRLMPGVGLDVATPTDSQCASNRPSYTIGMRPPVRLCPQFFLDSEEQRTRTLVREAAHMARISTGQGETLCATYDCQTPCGGFNNADAWSHFVHCLSGQQPERPAAPAGGPAPATPAAPSSGAGGRP